MEQLILRQAAIDALRTCYDTETITMDNGDEYINYGDAVGEIEQLPPIQPKLLQPWEVLAAQAVLSQPEITHEQAVAYLQSTGWLQEHDRQMMLDGVHRLTAQPEPHWIPVDLENNEPQLEEWVLVSSDGYVMQDCIVERGGKKIWYHGGNIQSDDRYMPLPEPYKEVTT